MKKGLVFGIICLFIGVGIYPAIAVNPITSVNITQEKEFEPLEEIEPKDYLFQTIIDIANNPNIKELFEQYLPNIFTANFDYKMVSLHLLIKNPILLFSMLFIKPSIMYEYLDSTYNRGIDTVNILGEEKVIEMRESIRFTKPELFEELNNIVMNDEELSERITTLTKMNGELKPDSPFQYYPILCAILKIIVAQIESTFSFLKSLFDYFGEDSLLSAILSYPMMALALLGIYFIFMGTAAGCWEWPDY